MCTLEFLVEKKDVRPLQDYESGFALHVLCVIAQVLNQCSHSVYYRGKLFFSVNSLYYNIANELGLDL